MPSTNQPQAPTDCARKLVRMRPLKDSLPLVFNDGRRVEQLVTVCRECGTPVPTHLQRGQVVAQHAHVAIIEGISICRSCRIGLLLQLRVYSDGRVTTLMGEPFLWARTSETSESTTGLIGRGLRRLARLFGKR